MKQKIAILVLFLISANQLLAQCAMCKAIAEDQEVAAQSSLNTGIIYIMVIPYILLFVLFRKRIFGFIKEMKNAKG